MANDFNAVGMYADDHYIDCYDTLEEAKKAAETYVHFGAVVTFRRGWLTKSPGLMNASFGVPSPGMREYRDSLIYDRFGVILSMYRNKKPQYT